MLNIICLIAVTVMAPIDKNIYVPWMVQEQVKGYVIEEKDDAYLIDFSKEASEKKYVGDYSNRMVQKSMCMRLKK